MERRVMAKTISELLCRNTCGHRKRKTLPQQLLEDKYNKALVAGRLEISCPNLYEKSVE